MIQRPKGFIAQEIAVLLHHAVRQRITKRDAEFQHVHAHALEAASISPLLVLSSPERRCGKTTTLKVMSALVPRALQAANISPAALFRAVQAFQPTLLLDEADTAFQQSEELRAIVNAGHDRAGAWAKAGCVPELRSARQ